MHNPLRKTVAGIMGDFGKKITALEKVQSDQNKDITARQSKIKDLKAKNHTSQAEISAAQKAINALQQFVR